MAWLVIAGSIILAKSCSCKRRGNPICWAGLLERCRQIFIGFNIFTIYTLYNNFTTYYSTPNYIYIIWLPDRKYIIITPVTKDKLKAPVTCFCIIAKSFQINMITLFNKLPLSARTVSFDLVKNIKWSVDK